VKKIISMEDFNITSADIDIDLSSKYNWFSKKQKVSFEREFKTLYDFVNILYYMRFIKKLEIREIANLLNKDVPNMHGHFYNLRWNYSTDYYENVSLFEAEKERLNSIKIEVDKEVKNIIDKKDFSKVKHLVEISKTLNKYSYKGYGFNTPLEYVLTCYYLTTIKRLSTIEISIILDTPLNTVQNKLERLQLNYSLDEAMKIKKKNNRQDYDKTRKNTTKTRIKDYYENGLTGSKNENTARLIFENILSDYFDKERYDLVVGVNTRNIISPKEVDIPIIIYDNQMNKIYRFAIEYNGKHVHEIERDLEKLYLLEKRKWIYFDMDEPSMNNHEKIDALVKDTCLRMLNFISVN